VAPHSTVPVRVRLAEGREGRPKDGVTALRLRYFRAPASQPFIEPTRPLGDGVYEAQVAVGEPGAYYVHLDLPRGAGADLSRIEPAYASLRVMAPEPADAKGGC
jgi:hypothetical protein